MIEFSWKQGKTLYERMFGDHDFRILAEFHGVSKSLDNYAIVSSEESDLRQKKATDKTVEFLEAIVAAIKKGPQKLEGKD